MADFLSIKDAARRLGVKPKEIRRRIKDGELDGFVRLPAGGEGERVREPAAFGPAAPNRRAAPPPEQVSTNNRAPAQPERRALGGGGEVQRLEETVLVLQSELNTRRQEVEELHVLLREIKDSLPVAPATPAPPGAPVATVAPTSPAELPASPAEPEIDWGAYDAESEQLRATMGRLEALLEQLEEPEPEPEQEPEPEPEQEPEPEPKPEPEPEAVSASMPAPDQKPESATVPLSGPEPVAATAATASTAASPAAPSAPEAADAPSIARPKPTAKSAAAPVGAAPDDAPTAEALSRRREKMGVSREALAAFARISWGFVTEVESGRRKDPRSRQRLSAALDAWQKRLADERRKSAT